MNEIEIFEQLVYDINILCDIEVVYQLFQMNQFSYYYSGIYFKANTTNQLYIYQQLFNIMIKMHQFLTRIFELYIQFIEITREQSKAFDQEFNFQRQESSLKHNFQKRHQKSNIDSYIIGGNYSHYINNNVTFQYTCQIQIDLDQFYNRKLIDHFQATIVRVNQLQNLISLIGLIIQLILKVFHQMLQLQQMIMDEINFWNQKFNFGKQNSYYDSQSYRSDLEIKSSQSKRINEIRWTIKQFKDKEEEVLFYEIFQRIINYLIESGKIEGNENKVIKNNHQNKNNDYYQRCQFNKYNKEDQQWFQNIQVIIRQEQDQKIKNYLTESRRTLLELPNININNRQGYKIGWEVDQNSKEDLKIANKVDQDQRNISSINNNNKMILIYNNIYEKQEFQYLQIQICKIIRISIILDKIGEFLIERKNWMMHNIKDISIQGIEFGQQKQD
ncbi:unnamed protein product [Paramecium sonneborni]|uniref:Uncharacterized protein n=1 Tax=Paramecium sonneborni TaxID=65129 RepID=A0A8S1RP10_9CILI|nr:unnamed protein product [Paramecium sonneborni]